MRVLWLCNIMLPMIADSLGLPPSNKEGWLSGLSERILREQEQNQVELGVCFPIRATEEEIQGKIQGITYYSFYEDVSHEERYQEELEKELAEIVADFKPDMVHIFGTEFAHSLAMTKAFPFPERILVGIQGICTLCAKEYMAELPEKIQKRFTLRDFLKQDNIKMQQEKFAKRGEREVEVIKNAGHVTGRTKADKEFCYEVNPKARYHFMNETLRGNFYQEKWNLETCEKHSIFVSQGDYPLKGFHLFVQALPKIKEKYPDVKVYVTGNKITNYQTLKQKLKIGSYGKYILDLINENNLQDTIIFMGMVDSNMMCQRMKQSHVLVSCSSMENSPNSVGEAMLLGLPVVSSCVGGVPSLLEDGKEGVLYAPYDTNALAQKITMLFSDDELAKRLSEGARARAGKTHDADVNYKRLMEIYQDITAEGNC